MYSGEWQVGGAVEMAGIVPTDEIIDPGLCLLDRFKCARWSMLYFKDLTTCQDINFGSFEITTLQEGSRANRIVALPS